MTKCKLDNDESDIFVHYSQIKEKGYKSLSENDEVSFTMFETKNGLQAKDVFITKKANLRNKVK